jgi:hypothetical protein
MGRNGEVLMFRRKLNDLKARLRSLKRQGLITDGAYYDYMLLIWKAKTIDQLDKIALDLAGTSKSLDHPTPYQ